MHLVSLLTAVLEEEGEEDNEYDDDETENFKFILKINKGETQIDW